MVFPCCWKGCMDKLSSIGLTNYRKYFFKLQKDYRLLQRDWCVCFITVFIKRRCLLINKWCKKERGEKVLLRWLLGFKLRFYIFVYTTEIVVIYKNIVFIWNSSATWLYYRRIYIHTHIHMYIHKYISYTHTKKIKRKRNSKTFQLTKRKVKI